MENKAQRILESLTPQGSEYHNDPERCADHIRYRFASDVKAKKERARFVKTNLKLTRALLDLAHQLSLENCPVCGNFVAEGHDKDCPLKDVLK